MTNKSIKITFLVFLSLAIIFISLLFYIEGIDAVLSDGWHNLLIPFAVVILIRVYNLLVYGKFVVDE